MRNLIVKSIFTISLLLFGGLNLLFAQPANDEPCTATNIGTLPTPGACILGLQNGAVTTLNNLTTVGATGPNPYVSITGCAVGGNMASPALDVWYTFVATGTIVNITLTGFPSASVGVWAGTCNNLIPRGCTNIPAGGTGSFTVLQTVIGQQYWVQVSGGTATATDANFSLSIDNDIDCNDCLLNASITANPPPVNGGYPANTTVNFCYTVTGWEQINTNWLHGVQITFGPGWTGGIQNPVPATTLQFDGNWFYYPTGIGVVNGTNWGPGFYFDTNDAGTAANNNFGDNCQGAACSWTFCWTMTTGACVPGTSLNVVVNTSGDGESGSWINNACNDDNATTFIASEICCSPSTIAQTNVSCNGGTNGTATSTGLGSSPWDYSWSNGTSVLNVAGPHSITGLAAGVYRVTVTDNGGCVSTNSVTITQPTAVTASIPTVVSVTCNGQSTGSATAAGAGGTGPYTFNWSNGRTTASNTGLAAGTYTVTVRDLNSCSATATVTITQPTAVTATIPTSTSVTCNGTSTGSATAAGAGGTGTYTFNWSNGRTTALNTGLAAGTFTVTVSDANLCTATASVTITQPTAVTASIPTSVSVSCNGAANGSATAAGAGGTGTYTFNWSNGSTTALNTGLAAGTFTVTVSDANLCTATASVTITQPTAVTASIPTVVSVTCNGLSNGSATAAGSGGTGTYTFNWSNGRTTALNTGLAAGTFTVTVSDANLCTATASVTISQPSAVTATIPTSVSVSCNGAANGSATAAGAGGSGTYTFNWSNGRTTAGGYTWLPSCFLLLARFIAKFRQVQFGPRKRWLCCNN